MRTDKKLWRNRKARKNWRTGAAVAIGEPGTGGVLPHAAGIDVGNSAHYVVVRPDRDSEPVRRFQCFTADLHRLADWCCDVPTYRSRGFSERTGALASTRACFVSRFVSLDRHGWLRRPLMRAESVRPGTR